MTQDIKMVDLNGQYLKIKKQIDQSISDTINSSEFIGGNNVIKFSKNLCSYLNVDHLITCANGTDALQIALMALDLEIGDEVIVPAYTYVATAEVIALLNLKPIMVDVDLQTYSINTKQLESLVTPKTKAIIPVHLFGQASNMTSIMDFAEKHNLYVIEDNAQSIGAEYHYKNTIKKTGTIGHIGTFSFFPSKNLGCFGDGGALCTSDSELAEKIKMIANHGQRKKYYHDIVGVNSRLDNLQAGILDVKLAQLDEYIKARQDAASTYDSQLENLSHVTIPYRAKSSSHVFHQYTIQVEADARNSLKKVLSKKGIPSMIYYPLPLYKQNAYKKYIDESKELENTENLCKTVLSLPMHTELDDGTISYICDTIKIFFS